MNTYQGSCHCGAVQYTVNGDITSVISCNCSYCYRKGSLLAFLPKNDFVLESGAENLTEYRFNKHVISHLFCKTCGVQSFGFGKDREGNETVAINVRTVMEIDPKTLEIHEYNGRDV